MPYLVRDFGEQVVSWRPPSADWPKEQGAQARQKPDRPAGRGTGREKALLAVLLPLLAGKSGQAVNKRLGTHIALPSCLHGAVQLFSQAYAGQHDLHAAAFFNWANRLMLSLGEPRY